MNQRRRRDVWPLRTAETCETVKTSKGGQPVKPPRLGRPAVVGIPADRSARSAPYSVGPMRWTAMSDTPRSNDKRRAPQASRWRSANPSAGGGSLTRFRAKVSRSRWAVWFERVWPRAWAPIGVAALFLFVSLLGIWPLIPEAVHLAGLAVFALLFLAALLYTLRAPIPSEDEGIRYLDHHSGVPHRPASAYEDTLSGVPEDSDTAAIWRAHRQRLQERLDSLKVAVPHADMPKRDPWALRVVGIGAVALTLALVGDGAWDRLQSAFRFQSLSPAAGARLDAWVTPPQYTARPPILLADGRQNSGQSDGNASNPANASRSGESIAGTRAAPVETPDQSTIIVRIGGAESADFSLELTDQNENLLQTIDGNKPEGGDGTIQEARAKLDPRVTHAKLKSGETQIAAWAFNVIPDYAPSIAFTKELEK